jgi:uncharacterized membrane protein YjgN (DUF898 family)
VNFLREVEGVDFDAVQNLSMFEFRGDVRDDFRVRIGNVALSIVAPGIYSAWA